MKIKRVSPRLLLICLGIFSSGWVPIPVPIGLLPERIDVGGNAIRVHADSVHLEWARGRFTARELRVDLPQMRLLSTPYAEIYVGLLPFASKFLRPHTLYLKNPVLNLDSRQLAELKLADDSTSSQSLINLNSVPELAFEITGGKLEWTLHNGQQLSWQVSRLAGVLSPKRSDVQLDGRMLTPIQSNVHAIATAEDFFRAWRFQIQGQNRIDSDAWLPQQIPGLRGLEVAPGNYSFKFAAASEPGQDLSSTLELNLENARVSALEPPLDIDGLMLRANGGLREGIHAEFSGTVDQEFQIRASCRMQMPHIGQPWLNIRGKTTSVKVDQDRFDWVRLLHPITADILEALEARGGPETSFSVDWRQDTPVSWAVHADTSGMTMRYRGILTDEGEKPAFPYPVQATNGDFVASDRFLLIHTQARAGLGRVDGSGVVEIYPERTALNLDIIAEKIRIDGAVRSAVRGIPVLESLWLELGLPKGGDADVEIRIRTENAKLDTGIEIFGQARGTQIRLEELPIPGLVEKMDFHWTPGLTTFEGDVLASQSRLHLQGKVRETQDSEYPSIQAKIEGSNIQPSWAARRVLVDRLELAPWLALGAPDGPSQLNLTYHQPGNTESPQVLLDFIGRGGDLKWGSQIGPKWIPLLTLNQVRTPYFLASSRHRFIGGVALGTMQFGGEEIEFSLLSGTDSPADGILLASQDLHTPEPVILALINLFKAKDLIGPLTAECWSNILVEWRGEAESPLFARLDLAPLRVNTPDSKEPLFVYGELTISEGSIRAPKFRLEQSDGVIELNDIEFNFGENEQRLRATIDSAIGMHIGPKTYHFLGPQASAALHQIGLAAEIRPQGIKLQYRRQNDEPGILNFYGGKMELRQASFNRPVSVQQGRATIDINQLRWTSGQGVFAQLKIKNGSAIVAGLPIQNASADLSMDPHLVQLTNLEAHALGGSVHTSTPATVNTEADDDSPVGEGSGEPIPGKLELGLTAEAPIEAQISFRDLNLNRLRDQLGIEPRASGKFSGWVKIKSPSLSPLDFKGRGSIQVHNGRLSEVPILEQIWRAMGINPPVFREGLVRFRLDGDSRVRISNLKLDHDLLDIEGKGWVHMDGSLDLKLALRQVRLLFGIPVTDLPLISHIFDLFTEQEVYGPIDNLHVSTRSMRKILGQELPRPPFPLWLPERRQRVPGSSPAIPLQSETSGVAKTPADG